MAMLNARPGAPPNALPLQYAGVLCHKQLMETIMVPVYR
jgi:hypothetical protein